MLGNAAAYQQRSEDPDEAEYYVRVECLDTKPEVEAGSEAGFIAIQNTVCRPKTAKWPHTMERLKTLFPKWQG